MKRGITILLSICMVATLAYFTASKLAIRHKTLTFFDPSRTDRPVEVDIAVRRDKKMEALAEMIRLPVVILNHGNTVKYTEYSFLANFLAMRGYLVVSIQHDLDSTARWSPRSGKSMSADGRCIIAASRTSCS